MRENADGISLFRARQAALFHDERRTWERAGGFAPPPGPNLVPQRAGHRPA
ncbi:hypothetical protein [Streptomyces azureus]|uniref:hypothetical protein n=1 Tax=Streptomyces azureus TaxID=146537 RepID=UPI000AD6317E